MTIFFGPPGVLDIEGLRVTPPDVDGREIGLRELLMLGDRTKSSLLPDVAVLLRPPFGRSLLRALNGPGAMVFILCRTFPPPFSLGLNGAYISTRSDPALLAFRIGGG